MHFASSEKSPGGTTRCHHLATAVSITAFFTGPMGPGPTTAVSMAPAKIMDQPRASSSDLASEDINLQPSVDSAGSGASLGLPRSTALVAGPNSVPVRTLLLPHNYPFAPLADLEHSEVEGKCNSFFTSAVRIITTAKQGQKRARGAAPTKHSVAARVAKPNYAGVRTKAHMNGVTDREYNSYESCQEIVDQEAASDQAE